MYNLLSGPVESGKVVICIDPVVATFLAGVIDGVDRRKDIPLLSELRDRLMAPGVYKDDEEKT